MTNNYLKFLTRDKVTQIADLALLTDAEYGNSIVGDQVEAVREFENRAKHINNLDKLLKHLTIDEMAELTALASLGESGAGETVDNWANLIRHSYDMQKSRQDGVAYLAEKRPLGLYLLEGLRILDRSV